MMLSPDQAEADLSWTQSDPETMPSRRSTARPTPPERGSGWRRSSRGLRGAEENYSPPLPLTRNSPRSRSSGLAICYILLSNHVLDSKK
uniref:Uncharacterized protein n=1 Tax=Seriola dumerili TaxID=41447 RepID=A0A3B4U3Z9_SERDU